jgi:hypothetical protein
MSDALSFLLARYDFAAVTPHDSTNLSVVPRAIYVGGTGNLQAVQHDGTVVEFTAVQAGTLLPIRPIRINSTLTTASAIVAIN